MRKEDYMANLRASEQMQGPLKIIKLPTPSDPINLSEATPRTLVKMGIFKNEAHPRINNPAPINRDGWQGGEPENADFEFHDVNE